MGFFKKLSLAVLSGLLIGGAWFSPFTFLIFIGFVPLLLLTEDILKNAKRPKGSVFLFSYIAFLLWNIMDTWWTWFASPGGSVFAITANAFLMSTGYLVYFVVRKSLREKYPALAVWLLIPFWLTFEYMHTNWELSWSWLNIGNVFSFQHNWVQWYEFTGVSGGAAWILAANILIYNCITFKNENLKLIILKVVVVITLPLIFSAMVRPAEKKVEAGGQNIVIVQPNIDPYEEKFFVAFETQLFQVYGQLKNKITDKTNYLILPETFFTENIWENEIEKYVSVKFFRDSILTRHPNLIVITGASTFYRFPDGAELTATARKFADAEKYYDNYNTAMQLDNFGAVQIYHKSILVPGVEQMPYPAFFKPLEALAIDLGGTSGSLGTQKERTVFFNKDKTVGMAPIICYESVFGEFGAEYIRNGANLICIMTNDGWWRDSPGYSHHLNYARLRAIETRCPVARCANTGISCFIDERGEIYKETKWWEADVISATLMPNNTKTFYVRFGDLLSKGAAILAIISIVMAIVLGRRRKSA
jgi:apolipoprotein N-acyltransferase